MGSGNLTGPVDIMNDENGVRLQRTREQIQRLAWLMDDCFRIPGLNWRFGLDSLVGLVPWAGDLVTGAVAVFLLIRAFQFRLPRIVIARMILNTIIDIVVGAVPILGDLFDFAWKSNDMNIRLFQQYSTAPEKTTFQHWLLIGVLIFGFLGIFMAVTFLLAALLHRLITAPWP